MPPLKPWNFIDNNAPLDRRSLKLVRNHAMKGKNLGRVIAARGHRGQQREVQIRPDRLTNRPECSAEGEKRRPLLPKPLHPDPSSETTLPLNPFSGAELAYFTGPVLLTPSIRYLFYECRCHSPSCLSKAANETVSSPL